MKVQDIYLDREFLTANVDGGVRAIRQSIYPNFGKRILDITLAILVVPMALVIVLVVGIIMQLTGDRGHLFFGHTRIGKDGRAFKCWKIRTMVADAECKLHAHLASNPQAAAEWACDHKLTNDPRVTKLGDFLRKTSLDELPQLWNVLKGEMSLVGPRPIVRTELHKYGVHRFTYKSVLPGVTGLWQVSGRNDISYDERVQLDVEYVKNASFLFDLSLISRTALSVMSRTGK